MIDIQDLTKVVILIVLMTVLFLSGFAMVMQAWGHEWYPSSCCGGQDCRPTPCENIAEDSVGDWLYIPTRSHLAPEQVQLSQDKRCHICINNTGKPICAFIVAGV